MHSKLPASQTSSLIFLIADSKCSATVKRICAPKDAVNWQDVTSVTDGKYHCIFVGVSKKAATSAIQEVKKRHFTFIAVHNILVYTSAVRLKQPYFYGLAYA